MAFNKKENAENTLLNLMQVDPRVAIRDLYATLFHKGAALAFMANADYDTGFRTYGRIEIIEFQAFGVWHLKNFQLKDQEEKRYFEWLKNLLNR